MHAPQVSVTDTTKERRDDIDGLRAVAVIAVLLFHLGFTRFGGGFVGVDVFFVISGYLITRMIVADVERDRFSMLRFYERRARRLLPALFICILLSSIASLLMFTPEHLQAFGRSAIAATFAASNITFWQETGYFDLSARLKPLLHTWTLSVEWQFYAIWPALLLVFMKTRSPAALVAAFGAISLLSTFAVAEPSTRFFLTPFRVFEFAIGALLIWTPSWGRWSAELAVAVGLIMIGYAVATFPEIAPSYFMLLPTVGAALILAAHRARITGLILRNPLSAYIGRISYSIYLVHWPLIIFAEYYFFRPLNRTETAAVFFGSLLLATLLYELFERPVHQRKMLVKRGWTLTAGATALLTALLIPQANNGLPWRLDADARGIRTNNTETLVDKSILGHIDCKRPCTFGNPSGPRVLVLGDSHIDHHTKTLNALGGDRFLFDLIEAPACFNGKSVRSFNAVAPANQMACDAAQSTLTKWFAERQYSAVIVGQWWQAYHGQLYKNGTLIRFPAGFKELFGVMLDETAAHFERFKGPIIFVGDAPSTNLSCFLRPSYLRMGCAAIPVNLASAEDLRVAFDLFRQRTSLDVRFIDVGRIICPNKDGCQTVDNQRHVLYTDTHHLSIYGSRMVVPRILSELAN